MGIITMDFEASPSVDEASNTEQNTIADSDLVRIINSLARNPDVVFKSQQRGEADLTNQEKTKLALDIFDKSKFNFLTRFGKHLSIDHLQYFEQFSNDSEEVEIILKELLRTKISHNIVKNRRYEALLQMVGEGKYFSDVEMMKRNPLLYEQLVGQYLSEDEKKERDKESVYQQQTFVKILMEGIERDNAEIKRQMQRESEEAAMEEDDSEGEYDTRIDINSTQPSYSKWGEYHDEQNIKICKRSIPKVASITAEERKLLKEEFVTSMYQNFLDGKDEDFDYDSVDNNEKYDNKDIVEHDEEDKYFDAEEPENIQEDNSNKMDESSEDELDIYMSALNNHPAIMQLSKDIKRM